MTTHSWPACPSRAEGGYPRAQCRQSRTPADLRIKSPLLCGSGGSGRVLAWECEPARYLPDAGELQPELQPHAGACGCRGAGQACSRRAAIAGIPTGGGGRRGCDRRAIWQPGAALRPRAVHTAGSRPHTRRTPWPPGDVAMPGDRAGRAGFRDAAAGLAGVPGRQGYSVAPFAGLGGCIALATARFTAHPCAGWQPARRHGAARVLAARAPAVTAREWRPRGRPAACRPPAMTARRGGPVRGRSSVRRSRACCNGSGATCGHPVPVTAAR